jgi:hypothetical protein
MSLSLKSLKSLLAKKNIPYVVILIILILVAVYLAKTGVFSKHQSTVMPEETQEPVVPMLEGYDM